MKKEDKTINYSPNTIAAIGALILLLGGFFLSYNYVQSKKIMAYDYVANIFYTKSEKQEEKIEETEEETKEETKEEEKEQEVEEKNPQEEIEEVTNEYIGYLNIPKINLTKGFLDIRSPENNVEKNILVVEGSNYPDTDKGNLILAGHSGTGWKAFFNDLYKLDKGDLAYITYKNKKYTYSITNIYTQPKVGKIAIYRNYDKTTLTLITCTNNDSTTQTVYIAELLEVS